MQRDGGGRRAATAPAVARHAGRRDRGRHVGAGHLDRQHRAAHHRARHACDAGRLDLGGERLPARGDGDAAAVRLDRRHLRPSARLCLGPRGLHRGIAAVRGRAIAAGAGARPRAARFWRRRHHERQRRAGALHLSARIRSAAASASTRWSSRVRPPPARRSRRRSCRCCRGPGCSRCRCRPASSRCGWRIASCRGRRSPAIRSIRSARC